MDPYTLAFAKTMKHEAGYADVIGDKGGETYRGISRVFWPTWEGWKLVDDWKGGVIGSAALSASLDPLVMRFYRVNFWDRFQGDAVAALSVDIACELFDTGVNMGSPRRSSFCKPRSICKISMAKPTQTLRWTGCSERAPCRRSSATSPGSRAIPWITSRSCSTASTASSTLPTNQTPSMRGFAAGFGGSDA